MSLFILLSPSVGNFIHPESEGSQAELRRQVGSKRTQRGRVILREATAGPEAQWPPRAGHSWAWGGGLLTLAGLSDLHFPK